MSYNILAIASDSSDLSGCSGTLSKFAGKQDCQVHIVLVRGKSAKRDPEGVHKYKEHKISEFSYDGVTQGNVNALRAVIDELKPSLAIIPSIRTSNQKSSILAGSALLACRSVPSVIMYDRSRSRRVRPSVFSLQARAKSTSKSSEDRAAGSKSKRLPEKSRVESFESQRIILLGDVFK